jgi:hypothetical protein
MTALVKVGFFYRSQGDAGVPSLLANSRGLLPLALRAPVAAYLGGGTLLAVSDGEYKDWFDPSKVSGKKEFLTDGIWLWPASFAYYVEMYGVAVPQEFLTHMEAQGWSPRPLNADELLRAQGALMESGFTRGDQPPPGAIQWKKP